MWRHSLMLAGLLIAVQKVEEGEDASTRMGLVRSLQRALGVAADGAVRDKNVGALEKAATVLALSYTFDHLPDGVKQGLSHEIWAPLTLDLLVGELGFEGGRFLALPNADIQIESLPNGLSRLHWSADSQSYNTIKSIASRPLVSMMSRISVMAGFHINHLRTPAPLPRITTQLRDFSTNLLELWRASPFSAYDPSIPSNTPGSTTLAPETHQPHTVLFNLLRNIYFATLLIVTALVSRLLPSPLPLAAKANISSQILHTLRSLSPISSRLGHLANYDFVLLSSIDLLTSSRPHALEFFTSILPSSLGYIPSHPVDRGMDLYFLNVAEHFTLLLPADVVADKIIGAAKPYLDLSATPRAELQGTQMKTLIEAAHSATLSALSAPHMSAPAAHLLGPYAETLLRSFPHSIDARQLRFGVKSLVGLCCPPGKLAEREGFAESICELVRHAALSAPAQPLPPSSTVQSAGDADQPKAAQMGMGTSPQGAYTLSLIDSLPHLTPEQLRNWLPLTAELVRGLQGADKRMCRERVVEVLESGEMDVERSQVCVAWWTTGGGRWMLEGRRGEREREDPTLMSGALQGGDGLSRL